MENFYLTDRIKETSRTAGLGNFGLDGAVQGFSAFSEYYSEGDSFYYAITDGTLYEVGSGVFHVDGSTDTIYRHPVRSSNANELVNFGAGIKEVFVTYAGFSSVYSASGVDGRSTPPQSSGMAFWASDQIIDYSPKVVFDSGYGRIGINQPDVLDAAIAIGGNIDYSQIRASGYADGGSGVLFSGVLGSFSGGRQLEPFLRNVADPVTGSDAILDFGGLVDQIIKFKPQVPKTILAGPTADCLCVDDYPSFRLLDMDDLPPEILAVSGWAEVTIQNTGEAVSGWADVTMTNRDNAISGWALYNDLNVSGWADATMSNRNTAISGWADYNFATSGSLNAVSGWALETIINSGVAVSGWARYYVDNQDHSATAVSGWADYNFATSGSLNAVSGWAGYSDVNVSGWARVYVDNQIGGEANHPYADSGVRKLDNTYMLDPYNSGTLLRLGLNDDQAAIVGISGGHGASNYTDSVIVGTKAGENSDSNICGVVIGYKAGVNASGNAKLIGIGCEAAEAVQESPRLIAIGNEVAQSGWNISDGIFFGNLSAYRAHALSADGAIGIGRRTFQDASGDFAGSVGIGQLSCRNTLDVNSGVYIGAGTAVDATGHYRNIGIGPAATNMSKKIFDNVMIGRSAGLEASGSRKSIYIGTDAGAFASGYLETNDYFLLDDNIGIGNRASFSGINNSGVIAIGRQAAEQASGMFNIYMGGYAGFKRGNRDEVIIKTINGTQEPGTRDADWRKIGATGTLDIQEVIQGTVRHSNGTAGNTSLHLGRGLTASDTTDRIGPHNTVSIGTDNADSVALKLWGFDATFTDLGTQSSGLLETRPTLTNRSSMTIINGSGFLCTNDGTGADGGPDGVAIFNKRAGVEGNYLTYGGEEIATENIAGTIIPCRYGYDSGIAISTGSTWMFISGILI